MFKQDKKTPTLNDLDPMPFGKHKGKPMQDVPAKYLVWLKEVGCSDELVRNYIFNSWDAIQGELNQDNYF